MPRIRLTSNSRRLYSCVARVISRRLNAAADILTTGSAVSRSWRAQHEEADSKECAARHCLDAWLILSRLCHSEDGDEDDDDDEIEVGNIQQSFRCPLTAGWLKKAMTSCVLRFPLSFYL